MCRAEHAGTLACAHVQSRARKNAGHVQSRARRNAGLRSRAEQSTQERWPALMCRAEHARTLAGSSCAEQSSQERGPAAHSRARKNAGHVQSKARKNAGHVQSKARKNAGRQFMCRAEHAGTLAGSSCVE
eukprot:350634-Chlamydomonas_euryale.AAC.4